jgi:hypothetical protein
MTGLIGAGPWTCPDYRKHLYPPGRPQPHAHATPLGLVIVLAIWAVALSYTKAESAIGLQFSDGGEAVWFYRDCRDGEGQDVSTWSLLPAPWSNQQSLSAHLGNVYPGYRLNCDLYLANTGHVALTITQVLVGNLDGRAMTVMAAPAASESGQVLRACPRRPAWGTVPAQVPANCRARVSLSVLVLPGAGENRSYGFGVAVILGAALGGR